MKVISYIVLALAIFAVGFAWGLAEGIRISMGF
jgi:hypothetical protein